jgi:hypothetical protein
MRPAPGMISSATSTSLQAAQAINEGEVHVLLRTPTPGVRGGGRVGRAGNRVPNNTEMK